MEVLILSVQSTQKQSVPCSFKLATTLRPATIFHWRLSQPAITKGHFLFTALHVNDNNLMYSIRATQTGMQNNFTWYVDPVIHIVISACQCMVVHTCNDKTLQCAKLLLRLTLWIHCSNVNFLSHFTILVVAIKPLISCGKKTKQKKT